MSLYIIWCAVCVELLGCAGVAKQVRQYTYPPDFRYITRDELRSTMWQLAYHSRELSQLMRGPDTPQQHRGEIIEQLRAMESAAARLGQSGWSSNHPLIDMNLPSFRRDIKGALEAVEHDPPNFLLVGPVTGACVYCHGGR
jgi:hypothetical protein